MGKKNNISPEHLQDLPIDPNLELTADELNLSEAALDAYARAHTLLPPTALKNTIMDKIRALNQQKNNAIHIDIQHPVMLDENQNWLDWAQATKDIFPPEDYDNIYMHPIRSDDAVDMFVIFIKEYVPEEVHHDVLESFILIEGSCACKITDKMGNTRVVHMRAGDYLGFELEEIHDIWITNGPAKGILQWKKLAA